MFWKSLIYLYLGCSSLIPSLVLVLFDLVVAARVAVHEELVHLYVVRCLENMCCRYQPARVSICVGVAVVVLHGVTQELLDLMADSHPVVSIARMSEGLVEKLLVI